MNFNVTLKRENIYKYSRYNYDDLPLPMSQNEEDEVVGNIPDIAFNKSTKPASDWNINALSFLPKQFQKKKEAPLAEKKSKGDVPSKQKSSPFFKFFKKEEKKTPEDLKSAVSKITFGTFNQSNFKGPYAGNQCTSMALSALIWSVLYRDQYTDMSATKVNYMLYEGDILHTALRDHFRLSSNRDRRVAIDDLPQTMTLRLYGLLFNFTRRECDFLVTTRQENSLEGFMTLQEYFRQAGGNAFLITIGAYSNAIWRSSKNIWYLFDSHGYVNYQKVKHKDCGSVWEFDTLSGLVYALTQWRGPEQIAQVLDVGITEQGQKGKEQKVDQEDKEPTEKEKKPTKNESPQSKAGVTSLQYDQFDDESGYISFMGGF